MTEADQLRTQVQFITGRLDGLADTVRYDDNQLCPEVRTELRDISDTIKKELDTIERFV